MIPNINSRGKSFNGVSQYLLHDIEKIEVENGNDYHVHKETSERVGFTETANLHTDDIEQASRYMAWLDMNREQLKENSAGRVATAGNVYHYSLSWHPDEKPDQEHMKAMAHHSVAHLGLENHQYYMVEHTDEPHKHVHVVINLVNPETGNIANVYRDKYALDKWANEYELQHEVYCQDRAKKHEALEAGERTFDSDLSKAERKAQYAEKASEIYRGADSSQAFIAGLDSEGLTLSQGNRGRLVIVDKQGDVHRLTGLISGVKVKDIEKKYNDLDRDNLPNADDLEQERKAQYQQWQQEQKQAPVIDSTDAELEAKKREYAEREEQPNPQVQQAINEQKIEIKREAKILWETLKERQASREKEKEEILRKADSPEEARQRAFYEPLIKKSEADKATLENISTSWLSSYVFKFRNGVSVADEIENTQKSIDDAKAKLEANTGGLSREDQGALNALRRQHWQQREELRNHVDKELRQVEETELKKANDQQNAAIIIEAKASSEAAQRLAGSVQAKTKSQAADVGIIKDKAAQREAEQKQQENTQQIEAEADMLRQRKHRTGKTLEEEWSEGVRLDAAMTQKPSISVDHRVQEEHENISSNDNYDHDFMDYYEEQYDAIQQADISEEERNSAFDALDQERMDYEQEHSQDQDISQSGDMGDSEGYSR